MKWFFWFAIFWMLPCISDGPDVTCSGPVMIVKIRTPSPCGSCASEALRPSGGEGRRVPPPRCLPVCATRICSFFGRMLAIARVCVCVQECGESVWVWETEPLHSFFFLPSQPSASALSLHLQSCCTRSKRTEVCVVFLKGRGGGVGVVRMMTRWKGPGEEETQECPFPLSPFSFSLSLALASSLSLSLCDVVCVRVCCVCVRERVKQVGYASADWTVNLHRRKQPFPDWGMSLNCHHTHFHNTCATWGDLWLSERRDAEGGRNWLKGQRILSSNHTLR